MWSIKSLEKKNFAKELASLMDGARVNYEGLAEVFNVSPRTVKNWLNEKAIPHRDKQSAVISYLAKIRHEVYQERAKEAREREFNDAVEKYIKNNLSIVHERGGLGDVRLNLLLGGREISSIYLSKEDFE